jgi:hypothetical protein
VPSYTELDLRLGWRPAPGNRAVLEWLRVDGAAL